MTKRNGKLVDLVNEALETEKSRREGFARKFPDVSIDEPPDLYGALGSMGSDISKKIGPPEKSIQEIKWRLSKFNYPYDRVVSTKHTFYEEATKRGILELLTTFPLLFAIRFYWWCNLSDTYYASLGQKSSAGHPLKFHRELMHELSEHVSKIERLATKYQIPPSVLSEYRSTVLARLLKEAVTYYPELPRRLVPANLLRSRQWKVERQVELCKSLQDAFRERGVESRQFAYEMTALLCSDSEGIENDNELLPTPVTIRRAVETSKNPRKTRRGNKEKKK